MDKKKKQIDRLKQYRTLVSYVIRHRKAEGKKN